MEKKNTPFSVLVLLHWHGDTWCRRKIDFLYFDTLKKMESKWSQWSERARFITQLQPLTAATVAVPLPAMFQHLVHKALGKNCLTAQTRPSGCNRREHFAPLLRQIADYPSSEIEPGPSATDAAGLIGGKKKFRPSELRVTRHCKDATHCVSNRNQMDRMELLHHVSNMSRVGGWLAHNINCYY